eukprot:5434756-Ditylum_brightwellii.AAC.1
MRGRHKVGVGHGCLGETLGKLYLEMKSRVDFFQDGEYMAVSRGLPCGKGSCIWRIATLRAVVLL